jgi:hypothetical protein
METGFWPGILDRRVEVNLSKKFGKTERDIYAASIVCGETSDFAGSASAGPEAA